MPQLHHTHSKTRDALCSYTMGSHVQADRPSRSCLELASKLRDGVVFPVVMDVVAQGLMRRLRLEVCGESDALVQPCTVPVS